MGFTENGRRGDWSKGGERRKIYSAMKSIEKKDN